MSQTQGSSKQNTSSATQTLILTLTLVGIQALTFAWGKTKEKYA